MLNWTEFIDLELQLQINNASDKFLSQSALSQLTFGSLLIICRLDSLIAD